MDRVELKFVLKKLWAYYQTAKLPSDEQVDMWTRNVGWIPAAASQAIVDSITKEFDNCPRNIPKAMSAAYMQMPHNQSGHAIYDQTEDFRFPISLMYRALEILTESGRDRFARYCEIVRMPLNDRERVLNKYHAITAGDRVNLQKLTAGVGQRVNQQVQRPEIAPLRVPGEEG